MTTRKETDPCRECAAGLCAYCVVLSEGQDGPDACGCKCVEVRKTELGEFFARVDAVNGDPLCPDCRREGFVEPSDCCKLVMEDSE